jgi:TolA-binding protein
MKEIRPLVIETDSDEVRALLRSAEADEPPDGAMRRVLTRAGVGVAIAAATTAMTTASASVSVSVSAAKAAPMLVGKWLAVVAVVGAGAVGAVHVARPWTSSILAGQAAVKTAHPEPQLPTTPAIEAAPAIEPAPAVEDVPAAPVTAPIAPPFRHHKAPPAASADIMGEIAAITLVRGALDKGDARGALAALDHYQQDYPRGTLAPEATVLRIEALQLAGDRSRAKALAESFLKAHPKSPHAQRVRSLLGAM